MLLLQNGNWIVFENDETVRLSLHRPSIKAVFKHWIGSRGHSVICTGADCGYCYHRIPKRSRYTASVLIDGDSLLWEFGDDVFMQLPEATEEHGWVNLKVTRAGSSRRTRYKVIEYNPNLPPNAPMNLYQCPYCKGYIFPPLYKNDQLKRCACKVVNGNVIQTPPFSENELT